MPELPGPGRTVAIADYDDCPFATFIGDIGDEHRRWVCRAHLYGVGDATRPIPEVRGYHPPPDWCPLRARPLTLEVRA